LGNWQVVTYNFLETRNTLPFRKMIARFGGAGANH